MNQERIKELSRKQDELRQKRNDLNIQVSDIQNEIDKLEIEKYDVSKYVGHWVKVKVDPMRMYLQCLYMYIDDVKRLISAPKFTGTMVRVNRYYDGTLSDISVTMKGQLSHIEWKDIESSFTIVPDYSEVKELLLRAAIDTFKEDFEK